MIIGRVTLSDLYSVENVVAAIFSSCYRETCFGVPDRDLPDRIAATISPERRGARGGTESGMSRQAARFA
jgi:hypothetical protein